MNIKDKLFLYQDLKYRDFHSSLVPNIDKDRFIGVRTPILRNLAKEMIKDGSYKEFIKDLPHYYYEENTLHSCILSLYKDLEELINELDIFLPYVDNWAVCDSLRPSCFKDNKDKLILKIYDWIKSNKPY